ncbi:MAG TPA: hypothetical protein VI542_28235 [Candidatus Tectomicrobia bacterium]
MHTHLRTVGLAVVLLGLATMVVFAQPTSDGPGSRGVVATITALDARTSMATLRTDAGEMFALPQESQWHVGHKVVCDRIDAVPPRLERCQLWESAHEAGDAAARRERSTPSK